MKNILIIGATSSIAKNCAKIWANEKNNFYLTGRNKIKLNQVVSELKEQGNQVVMSKAIDLNKINNYSIFINEIISEFKKIDIVLIAHGSLGDQKESELNLDKMMEEINTNALSTISLLTILANYFEKQKNGSIAVISSVAGEKGRAQNYVYGSSKAMVTTFLSGLRQRLNDKNVAVITIKLGMVDTPMTKQFKKGFLWSKPDKVAKKIVTAIKNNNEEVYIPKFWWLIVSFIKLLPNKIFKKIKF